MFGCAERQPTLPLKMFRNGLLDVGDAEADKLLDVRTEEGVKAARRADAEAQALEPRKRALNVGSGLVARHRQALHRSAHLGCSVVDLERERRKEWGGQVRGVPRRLEGRGRVKQAHSPSSSLEPPAAGIITPAIAALWA